MGIVYEAVLSLARVRRLRRRQSMASGFGVRGPVGRCYPVFMEFSDCLVAEGDRMKCGDLREDYMECLHHSKEVTRINALIAERTRKQKAGEPIPPTLVEEMAKGQLKVPFTKA